jgi:hypothetical protein
VATDEGIAYEAVIIKLVGLNSVVKSFSVEVIEVSSRVGYDRANLADSIGLPYFEAFGKLLA